MKSFNRVSINSFISRSNVIHHNKYDYSKIIFINVSTPINIICPVHDVFSQRPRKHLEGQGCPNCNIDSQKLSADDLIKRFTETHGNEYDYSLVNYQGIDTKISIICVLHGIFYQSPFNHMSGQGCPGCNGRGVHRELPSNEVFIEKCIEVHQGKYDYSKTNFIGVKRKIIIICPVHGDFLQNPYNHLSGQGCPKCISRISKGEKEWLDSLLVPDDANHRYVYLKINDRKYYADGFDPLTNIIYEFYGDYWHGNPSLYKSTEMNNATGKTFGELYDRTMRREIALSQAGYKIVSIWQFDWNKLRKL
jgi:Protein of unknown function (DUF723)